MRSLIVRLSVLCTGLILSDFAIAQLEPSLDYGCAALSYRLTDGRLLVTDGGGQVFLGDLQKPLQLRVSTSGDVSHARFIAGGQKILLTYRSGALEIIDSRSHSEVEAALPAYTYMDVKVSSDGRWAVGLPPGSASADVLDLSDGTFRKSFTYEHPLSASLKLGQISAARKLASLIDEQGKVQLLDLERRYALPAPRGVPDKAVLDVGFLDDYLWVTQDTGVMPIGGAYPLDEYNTRKVNGINPFGSAKLLSDESDPYYVSSDDLGFFKVLRRTSERSILEFKTVGEARLLPKLVEAVMDPRRNSLVLCGTLLEVQKLDTGEAMVRERARRGQQVYVENLSDDGSVALVRDILGRSAIWDNQNQRFVAALPRISLEVFPAFSALNQKQVYLAQGQRDVLSLARPNKLLPGDSPSFTTEAIPLPSQGDDVGIWMTRAVFGFDDKNEAYIARKQGIFRIEWSDIAKVPVNFGGREAYIKTSESDSSCSSFEGVISSSPTGRNIAVVCNEGVAVFDLQQRRRVALITPPSWKYRSERVRVWVPSLDFSKDGDFLVFGVRTQHLYIDSDVDRSETSKTPSIYLFDWRRGYLSEINIPNLVPVTSVAMSPDNRYVWIGGVLGSLSVYDLTMGRVVSQVRGVLGSVIGIYLERDGSAQVWTDSGNITRITGGPKFSVASSVSFLDGAQVRRQSGEKTGAIDASSELSLINIEPKSFLDNPIAGKELKVELTATERYQFPAQVFLYADNEVIARGQVLESKEKGRLILSFHLSGDISGEISIGLYSYNSGVSPTVYLGSVSNRGLTKPNGRVVGAFVGIGQYDSPELEVLPLAKGDAQALANAMRSSNSDLHTFPSGQAPTKAAVLQFIKNVRDLANPEDTLIVHLSGHGLTTTKSRTFIFATKDTKFSDQTGSTGVTSGELIDLVAAGRQGATLLILDACNSGSFIEGVLQDPRLSEGPLSLGTDGRGLADSVSVIAAAPAFRVAKEGYKGRGVLTAVMIEGLAALSKDNENGAVTQAQLLRYVDLALGHTSSLVFPTEKQEPVLHYATRDFEILRKHIPAR
ncbi:hypothetical protein C4K22_2273 [Pseudomonas chlororaphis subsp. aurantiaca]|uniref:WD40 repeat domain-containing protein n=1 Tax=Pseudomonas chlororaphis TaxID=587753 RepID=UPI000F559D66|nr:WD40 repeat domain-containing protein [Pseudomonas chlororaphis]AZD35016.1 hypothetical protein C4K22_2273 [Pseudomonas chlororaphis subsp. aurantiaca]AZD41350.1 hypothetical protein C4K21_2276 [Pseudomonas chlororaphis subsp. aurantiaca]